MEYKFKAIYVKSNLTTDVEIVVPIKEKDGQTLRDAWIAAARLATEHDTDTLYDIVRVGV